MDDHVCDITLTRTIRKKNITYYFQNDKVKMCRTKYREEITITNFVATLFKTEYFNWNLKLWALSLLKFLSEVKSKFRTLDQAAISNTCSSPNFEHLIFLYILPTDDRSMESILCITRNTLFSTYPQSNLFTMPIITYVLVYLLSYFS